MLEELKQSWHYFKAAPPGKRFQQHFKRRQQARSSSFQKVLFIGGGLLLIVAGLVLLLIPGPGSILLLLGAALIAQESFVAARALDWIEIRVRKLVAWSMKVWRHSSALAKILLVLVALTLLGAGGVGVYQLLFTP